MEGGRHSTSTSTVLSTMIALSHHRRTYVLDGQDAECGGCDTVASMEADVMDGVEVDPRGSHGIDRTDGASDELPTAREGASGSSTTADVQPQPRPMSSSHRQPMDDSNVPGRHPPIVHAIGGSVGSALALLLLYPLERARIEMMQCQAEAERPIRRGGDEDDGPEEEGAPRQPLPMPDREDSQHSASSFAAVAAAVGRDNGGDGDREEQVQDGVGLGTDTTPPSSSSSSPSPSPSPGSHSSPASSVPSSFVVLSEGSSGGGSGSSSTSRSGSPTSTASSSSCGVHVEVEDAVGAGGGEGEAGGSGSGRTLDKPPDVDGLFGATAPLATDEAVATGNGPPEAPSSSSTAAAGGTSPNSNTNNVNLYRCLISLYRRGELYRGALPVTVTLAVSNFVYFYAHEVAKGLLLGDEGKRRCGGGGGATETGRARWWRSLLASTLAGVVNVLLTNPLWVANMRIIESGRRQRGGTDASPGGSAGLLSTLIRIARDGDGEAGGGIRALWGGTVASLLLVSNPALQHFVYDRCRARILLSHGGKGKGPPSSGALSPSRAFLLGAFSKAVATVVTYPLQLAQVLLRAQRRRDEDGEDDDGGRGRIERGGDDGEDEDENNDPARESSSTTSSSSDSQSSSEVAPVRQLQRPSPRPLPRPYTGTVNCLRSLYSGGGVAALYAGIDAKLTQTVLTAAFTFLTYERVLSWVGRGYQRFYHPRHPRHPLPLSIILPSWPSPPHRRRRGIGP